MGRGPIYRVDREWEGGAGKNWCPFLGFGRILFSFFKNSQILFLFLPSPVFVLVLAAFLGSFADSLVAVLHQSLSTGKDALVAVLHQSLPTGEDERKSISPFFTCSLGMTLFTGSIGQGLVSVI